MNLYSFSQFLLALVEFLDFLLLTAELSFCVSVLVSFSSSSCFRLLLLYLVHCDSMKQIFTLYKVVAAFLLIVKIILIKLKL